MTVRAEPTATRLAIVGTAGHIDHGKTALVRRLTGVDTDRLPEEKRRGISIDLGFAPLVTPGGVRVGIVDVPGHERFIKNMLAGVGGIDLVLLVVAADEGVMPQTREHLAIVKMLGVSRGIVALTKSDLVESEWIAMVTRDVRALLAGSPLADAPVVPCSAVTGLGLDALLAELDRQLASLPGRSLDEPARLPVDRVFSVEGFGTVITGTLWRGRVRTGDTLALLPRGVEVRVRRAQVHGKTVEEALAGQRTALAIHGVERDKVARGDWLVAPGSLQPSRAVDVRFELLADHPRPWPSNRRVRLHLGASEVLGRLVLLEGENPEKSDSAGDRAPGRLAVRPGGSALAQLRLERPVVAARGDRFVIRSYSPQRTIGGGVVIDPVAEKRRRRGGSVAQLVVHESGSIEARLLERLGSEPRMLATAHVAQMVSESEVAVGQVLEQMSVGGEVVQPIPGRWLRADRWASARGEIARVVGDYATRHLARFGIAKGELKSGLKGAIESTLFDAAFESLLAGGEIVMRADRVRPAGSSWEPPADVARALEKVEADLETAGFGVPDTATWLASVSHAHGGGPAGAAFASEVGALGQFLGRLVRVSQEYCYTARQMDDLEARLAKHFAKSPTINVAGFKDLAGVSRKWAVPLLEHSDRVGWTVRAGDERKRGRL